MSIVRNSGYNLAAALVPVAVSLLTIPPYIAALGEARYGVLIIFVLLVGYFGVFDFGLSAATAQRVAAADRADPAARSRIVWTAGVINLGFGVAGGLACLAVGYLVLSRFIAAPPELGREIAAALPWVLLALPLNLLSSVMRGALQGANRFAEFTLVQVICGPLGQLLPLLVAVTISPSLIWVIPATLVAGLVTLLALAWLVAWRVTAGWSPAFDRSRARDLLSFGGWVAVSGLVAPMMSMLDRFVIGAMLGARAVSHYTVPYQLGERLLVIPGALGGALFPRFAVTDAIAARVLAIRALRGVAAVMLPVMLAGVLFLEPFLTIWITPSFAAAAALPGAILLCGFWFNALGFCCHALLQGSGRPRLIAAAHVFELLPYFAMLAAGLRWFGLAGAATAFALRVLGDALLLARFGGIAGEVARLGLIAAPALGLGLYLGRNIALDRPESFALPLLLLAVVSVGAVRWLAGERETLRTALFRPAPASGSTRR